MPISSDSLNRKLYDLLNARGYDPVPRDSDVASAGKTVPPEEADVFKFTFKQGNKPIDDAWVSVDGAENLTLYYDQDLADQADERTPGTQFDDSWYGLLRHLKKWAHARQLSFKLEPKEKIDSDMAQRTYMKKKEQIAEGYYPMGKSASYSDAVPTVKIILQHTRQVQEGEQRYRNVAKIFLENAQGERFLSPTNKPGLAQVYARHLAEGGVPNDDRWNHLKSLCEEYSKMAGFVRAVRGNQFNESAQRVVEAGLNHYQSLRESLGKLRGHRGYTAYFESYTPPLMEDDTDNNSLNELFVQETLDPRIESVMPILSKLSKNLGEMKEISELAEWADSLIEGGDGGEASEEQVEHIEEAPGDVAKKIGGALKTGAKAIGKAIVGPDDDELLRDLKKRAGVRNPQTGKPSMAHSDVEKVDEEGVAEAAKWREHPDAHYHDYDSDQDYGKKRAMGDFSDTEDELQGRTYKDVENGKLTKGGSDYRKTYIKRSLGKHPEPNLPESEEFAGDYKTGPEGQWRNKGPKANKPAKVGDLVGENFINTDVQAVVSEMDSEGYKGTRDDDSKGPEGKAKPIKAKDFAKDAEKKLNKAMDKAHKKDVKEGQEDLDAILRIIRK